MTFEEREKRVDEILSRGIIVEILPSREEFRKALLEKKLIFYIGADPTGDSLHLSHAKNFMLLEEFRQLGHHVNVLFGDFTACIGDPSDRESSRTMLTREKARENAASWVSQISRIINFDDSENPAHVRYNSEWIDQLTPLEMVDLFTHTTVQQLIERDMFQRRLDADKPIFLNEFVYPMFQGYDSVAMDVDVELCGTDQIFNALMGRSLVRDFNNKEKFVVAVNLMANPVTGELMSKSNGTGVFLKSGSVDMFGQLMQQPDEMIEIILINNTRIPLENIKELDIPNHPMEAKMFMAYEVTKIFHGEDAADHAKETFISTFSKRKFPENAPIVNTENEKIGILDLVCKCMPNESKSNARRLISQSSVSIDGEKHSELDEMIEIPSEGFLEVKIGKRGFYRVQQE
ncbi:MAG: tyrosine--tRNA ligase [Candidatus Gastranaerophilales bacterium]|nr:tyrosine--tRNA ligase [Candidatus Gastranaerophilales bacterium]